MNYCGFIWHLFTCFQYGDGKKRRKPNYSSVDLSEVEWEDKDDTVSEAIGLNECLKLWFVTGAHSGAVLVFVQKLKT